MNAAILLVLIIAYLAIAFPVCRWLERTGRDYLPPEEWR